MTSRAQQTSMNARGTVRKVQQEPNSAPVAPLKAVVVRATRHSADRFVGGGRFLLQLGNPYPNLPIGSKLRGPRVHAAVLPLRRSRVGLPVGCGLGQASSKSAMVAKLAGFAVPALPVLPGRVYFLP